MSAANKINALKERIKFINFPFLILAGIINSTGVTLLLVSAGLLDGGISGVSIFLSSVTGLSMSIFLVALNVPLFIIGIKKQGLPFFLYSITAIASYSLVNYLYQDVFQIATAVFDLINDDILLCAIFGGVISGVGSGLTIRFGGAIDGIEVMAVLFAKKIGITVGQFVMVFNVILYIIASIVTGNLAVALYSVVSYAVGLKAVDFVVEGFDKGKACFIITDKGDEMAAAVSEELGRGITVLESKGFYSGQKRAMLYCVINRFEIGRLKRVINRVDQKAFVTVNEISEALGGNIKESLLKLRKQNKAAKAKRAAMRMEKARAEETELSVTETKVTETQTVDTAEGSTGKPEICETVSGTTDKETELSENKEIPVSEEKPDGAEE